MKSKFHRDFLPAVLEVQETPPSPLGRIILWIIIGLIVTAVIWASQSKVDIVAITRGKIVVSQLSRPVNTAVLAEIVGVRVKEGDRVQKGDVLVELNSESLRAQIEENKLRQRINHLHIERLATLHLQYEDKLEEIQFPPALLNDPLSTPVLIQLRAEIAADREAKQVYQQEKRILQTLIDSYQMQYNMAQELLPIYQVQHDALDGLYKRDMTSKDSLLEIKKAYLEAKYSVDFALIKISESKANYEKVDVELRSYVTDKIRQAQQERIDKLNENEVLEAQLKQLNAVLKQYTIVSPVNGKIESLVYRDAGAVVEPPQELLKVVPENEKINAEVWISNQDVGFLQRQQEVVVKVDTFDFTRYGWIKGKLVHISADAIEDKDMGLVYKAVVELEDNHLDVEGTLRQLEPGMAVSAEIKTGQRTVLSYLISPMMEALDDVGKQR
ncbi:HlyD family type I secretion periplasmic adaptor subunit [Zophobihabitans entericus]|uniref:Membrane fusion protein (MFP) family protein n=1 Tax=Zophobihabitans entericus TaxID=1635327 RepID=A0A6G9I7N5_9GAMM|nr:HlyD family type I secretion periplasmic adaptor subunit [Zophobihabitans entericus]QIQ20215.1 HlyD family type I secretion periplasmic adaptor subunit [Zophobihabitans entericus]